MYDRAAGWPPRLSSEAPGQPDTAINNPVVQQARWPKQCRISAAFIKNTIYRVPVGVPLPPTRNASFSDLFRKSFCCGNSHQEPKTCKKLDAAAAAALHTAPLHAFDDIYDAAVMGCKSSAGNSACTAPPSQALQQCYVVGRRCQLRQSYLCTPQLASNSF
jgi:hypothetical protein